MEVAHPYACSGIVRSYVFGFAQKNCPEVWVCTVYVQHHYLFLFCLKVHRLCCSQKKRRFIVYICLFFSKVNVILLFQKNHLKYTKTILKKANIHLHHFDSKFLPFSIYNVCSIVFFQVQRRF